MGITSLASKRELSPDALAGIEKLAPLAGDMKADVIKTMAAELNIPSAAPGAKQDFAALLRPEPVVSGPKAPGMT